MTVAVSNTNLTDSFNTWRLNTNLTATVLSNNVVTVTRAGSANRGGVALGNAHIQGSFSATNIRTSTLKGGNNSTGTGGALTIASNTTVSATSLTISANTTFTGNVTFTTAGTDRVNLGDVSRLIIGGGTRGQFLRLSGSVDNPAFKSLTLRDITDLSSNTSNIILSGANSSFTAQGGQPAIVFSNGTDYAYLHLASDVTAGDSDVHLKLVDASGDSRFQIADSSNSIVGHISSSGVATFTANVVAAGFTSSANILPNSDDAVDLGAPNREFRNVYIDGIAYVDELSMGTSAGQGVSTSLIPKTDAAGNLGSATRKWGTVWADNTNGGAGVFSSLGVSGAFTANGTATFNGGFALNGDVDIGDSAADTFTITAQVDSDFDPQTGSQRSMGATNNRWHEIYANTVYANNITTDNNVTVGGDLTVTGATSLASGQTFTSPIGRFTNVISTTSAEFEGNVTLGSDNTDNIVINGLIDSSIIPDDDDSFDLGSASKEWRNLYVDGTASIDTLTVDVAATLGGDRATVSGNAHITGTAFIGGGIKDGATTVIGANAKLHANNTITAKTITTTMIANTMTSGGNFGSATQIPIINVNDRGQVTGILETTAAVVTGLTYSSANNNIRISAANGKTFDDVIDPATTSVRGVASFDSGDFDVSSGAVSLKNAATGAVLAISATANETTVSRTNGTVTVGLPDDVTIAGQLNVGENVIVTGNLIVSGTTTTVNSETVNIADNIIVLNSNYSGSTPSENGGITIERGTKANYSFLWDEGNDRWTAGDRNLVANTFIGNLTGSASSVDPNSVALGTDTTGDYVASFTVGTGLDTTTATGEGSTPNITLDLSELSTSTTDGDGDFFVVVDSSNVQRKLTKGNIAISGFNTTNGIALGTDTTGNYIAAVSGGVGITTTGSGEGATGTITLDLNELTTSTDDGDGDFFAVVRSDGAQRKLTKGNIAISGFNTTNGIALGTDTTGNYVATIAAGAGIDVSGSGSETAAVTVSIESDLRGDVTYIGVDTNDYYRIQGTVHDWYLDGVLDMRLENDGDLHIDGDMYSSSTITSSDIKLKKDISVVENALQKVEQLEGVEFTWKKNDERSAGVIAQNVLEVLPQAVKEVEDLNGDDTYLSVNYDALHALLIEAVKELSARVKELESK
jgi:hypothetical protein